MMPPRFIEARAGMTEVQGVVFRLVLDAMALRAAVEAALEAGVPRELVMNTVDSVLMC